MEQDSRQKIPENSGSGKKKSDNMIVDPTEDVEQLYHAFDTVLMVIKWSLMV